MRRTIPVLALVAGIATLACTGTDRYRPGTPLGTFRIDAALTAETCGPQEGFPNPWSFRVDLSRAPGILYWLQGGAPVEAPITNDGHATLHSSGTYPVRAATPKVAGCTLVREDVFEAALPVTGEVTSLTGTLGYRYSVEDGSDCAEMIGVQGGFSALPCEIHYDVTGTRTVAPK